MAKYGSDKQGGHNSDSKSCMFIFCRFFQDLSMDNPIIGIQMGASFMSCLAARPQLAGQTFFILQPSILWGSYENVFPFFPQTWKIQPLVASSLHCHPHGHRAGGSRRRVVKGISKS
jgi:hypothetical protein